MHTNVPHGWKRSVTPDVESLSHPTSRCTWSWRNMSITDNISGSSHCSSINEMCFPFTFSYASNSLQKDSRQFITAMSAGLWDALRHTQIGSGSGSGSPTQCNNRPNTVHLSILKWSSTAVSENSDMVQQFWNFISYGNFWYAYDHKSRMIQPVAGTLRSSFP